MTPRVVVDATTEPLSYDDIVEHSRIVYGHQRSLIESYITGAREACENYTSSTIARKTLEIGIDAFVPAWWGTEWMWRSTEGRYVPMPNGCAIVLPLGPVRSIVWVKYVDTDGDEQTLDAATYALDLYRRPQALRLAYGQSWPATRAQPETVKIRYEAGWPSDDSPPIAAPQAMLHAIRLTVDHWNENKTAVDLDNLRELPLGVKSLLDPYRLGLGV